ncbi:MAG: GIY-YIG nuclease family protein, partial [Tidjanibacter sp.]|nr:GIY-YIG nuclease family protein [Tidjanibacter sp.]
MNLAISRANTPLRPKVNSSALKSLLLIFSSLFQIARAFVYVCGKSTHSNHKISHFFRNINKKHLICSVINGLTHIKELKESVALLPTTPGVYQFLDASGRVIYVGKAINLRRRVGSYFVDSSKHSAKVKVLVQKIRSIKHIDTPTEHDALLLENSLIKTLKPRYNILLKDDKTYPWIVVRNEPFPRVESTRRVERDGSSYFGPYSSVVVQRAVLESLREIYQIRTCALNLNDEAIAKHRYRVCLQYHIGNCAGPCEGHQSEEEYKAMVDMVRRHLRGDLKPARDYLASEME